MVDADPRMTGGARARLAVQPQSPGLAERIWWGSGTRATAVWTAEQGMNLMSSTLLSDGRLQLGVSRGSPETALRGSEAFGYVPPEGTSDADLARDKTALFLAAVAGRSVVDADPRMTGGARARLAIQPQSPGLADRIWWGSGTRATAEWTAHQGMNLMSSTLLVEDTGVPFDELQAEQIARYRAAWAEAGWGREPRVSVSRWPTPIRGGPAAWVAGWRSSRSRPGWPSASGGGRARGPRRSGRRSRG